MNALDRKLFRDIWRMGGQALAITLVVMCGVGAVIMFVSTIDSLSLTRDRYYRESRFSDVFVSLKRAPDSVRAQIRAIPGVEVVQTRVSAMVKLDVPGFPEPVAGRIVSIPDNGTPLVNRLHLRKGRLADPAKSDEAVICDSFAEAHGFDIGSTFGAVINGRSKTLTVTGIALSPEFILQMRPEAISPDFKRFGILWMGNRALSRAYDMEGAFNDVVLTVSPGVRVSEVITRLDNLLDRYGSLGAYGRKDQLSHRIMSNEFVQLRTCSRIFPVIFTAVAAFLLNVVVSRIVSTQREQIATLKAFGYSNGQVAVHYVKLVIVLSLVGVVLGIFVGVWLGRVLGGVYMVIYRFPYLDYVLRPSVAGAAVVVSVGAALLGSLHALWRAAGQPPAEALRPEPPAQYRVSLVERAGLAPFLSQPTKMIVRNIERRPLRSALSLFGVAIACSTMLAAGFFRDAVWHMVRTHFVFSQKEDLSVSLTDPTSGRAVLDLKGIGGVTRAEAYRLVPVRLRKGIRTYKTVIIGLDQGSTLRCLLDGNRKDMALPARGIVLTDYFQKVLGVKAGDLLTVEALEGLKPVRQVPVVGFTSQDIGLRGFMSRPALNRMLLEGDTVSGVYLMADPLELKGVYRALMDMPRVAGTVVLREEVKNFYETQARPILFFTFVATLTACSISFGVVYNSMRIALSERCRELSSLRVLGYTRGEISYILLGELGLLTLLAVPLGFLIGRVLCLVIARLLASDIFRVPMVLSPRTYALAAAVVLASACVSGLVIRFKLDRLDLVEVLKTKE